MAAVLLHLYCHLLDYLANLPPYQMAVRIQQKQQEFWSQPHLYCLDIYPALY